MDILTVYEHCPNTQMWIMNKYFTEIQGHIRANNAKEIILYARQKFQDALQQRKGPPIMPTVFRNHPKRYEFIREREKQMHKTRSPKNPPGLPVFKSLFIDDIYLNILSNIRFNEHKGFIKHGYIAKLVCLNSKSCAEDAFEELLSAEPRFYSFDFGKVKSSKFTDNQLSNWGPLPTECKNSYMFIVDFSAIYPENLVSTVYVTCMECGHFFETVFCDVTKELIKKEIMYNIGKMDSVYEEVEERRKVIRLQNRGSKVKGCPFVEGLVGVKSLSATSVFVRSRITLYCIRSSPIGHLVHNPDVGVEPGLFPIFDELMASYNLY